MLLSALAALAIAGKSEPVLGAKSGVTEMQGLHAYGQCVAIQHPIDVRALLALDFRTPSYGRKLMKLVNRPAPCPGIEVPRGAYASGTLLWSGALAEGLLRRDRVLDRLEVATAHNPALPNVEARNAGEMLAYCVIRTSPGQASQLLKTEPATSEEIDAIRAISPTLSTCVPANSKSEFTRDSLRALIALGAYRLAEHNQQAKATGAAN